jgi:PAS domain S-box-containing protein
MQAVEKTKEELVAEVAHLQQRVAELEASERERKQVEEPLKRSEQEKAVLFDSISEHVVLQDTKMRVQWVNRAAGESVGVDPQQLVGRHCYEIWQQRSKPCVGCPVVKARKSGQPQEAEMTTPDGKVWFIRGYPVRETNGNIIGAVEVTLEITARKRAEESLKESEERYRTLVENINCGINLIDADHNIIMVNNPTGDKFKKPVHEIIGNKCFREFEKRDAVCPHCPGVQTLATGKPAEVETMGVRDDGSRFDVRVQTFPVFGQDGSVTAFIEFVEDITESKRAEEALRESEERFRALFEGAPDAIFLADPESGEIIDANPAASHLLLRPHEEIVGMHQSKIHPLHMEKSATEGFTKHQQQIRRKQQITPIESFVLRSDGNEVPVEVLAQIVHIHGRSFIQGTFRDITERKRAEEALEESEKRYRNIFETIPVSIIVLDKDGQMVDINPYHLTQIAKGQTPKGDFVGKNIVTHPTIVKSGLSETYKRVLEGEPFDRKEVYFPFLTTGADGYFNVRGVPLLKDDEVIGAVVIHEDITNRKQAEEALRQSEERYRFLFENSQTINILIGTDAKILDVNESAAESLGYKKKSIIGKEILEFVIPEQREAVAQQLALELKGEYTPPLEIDIITKNGTRTLLFTKGHATLFEKGEMTGMLFSAVDITERKQSEEALKQSEERFRGFIETSNDLVFQLNRIGRIDYVSPRVTELYGYETTELIGKHLRTTTPVKEVSKVLKAIKKILTGKALENFEINQKDKVGRIIPMEVNAVPIYKEGKIVGIQGVMRNITARKQAEEKLRESEERFRTICETAQDFIALKDRDCKFTYVNPAMERDFGIPASKLIGRTSEALFGKKRSAHIIEEDLCVLSGEIVDEEHPSPVEGSSTIHHIIKVPIRNSAGEIIGLCNIGRDITERKQTEEALKESEEKFRELAEQSPNMIFINAEGRVVYANKECEEKIGYTRKDFYDPNFDFFTLIAPESKDMVKERYDRHMKGEDVPPYEYTLITKKGERIEAIISPKMIQYGGESAILGIVTDITERKRMEEELRESEEKYRSLVESSEDSIYLVDNKCTYIFLNNRHLSRLGVQSSQIIGKGYSAFHSPEESKDFAQRVKKVFKTGRSQSYEYRSQRDNRYFIRTLSPVKSPDGSETTAITVISKDITERKQAEEMLREREAFNFALFQYNPVETIVVDLDGRITRYNQAKKNSGDRLPAIGDLMYKDYAGKHEIDMRTELMKCIKSGKIKAFPERQYCGKYLSITISPFSQGAIIISEDITERKRAEEALRASEQFSSSLLNDAPHQILVVDSDTSIQYVNPAFEKLTGFSSIELIGRKVPYPWWPKGTVRRTTRDLREAMRKSSRRVERKFQKKSGEQFWVEITSIPAMRDGEVQYLLGNWIDITERKQSEELLQKERDTFYSILERAPYGVRVVDAAGNNSFLNPEFTSITGYTLEDIPTAQDWLHRAYPDQHYRNMVEMWEYDRAQSKDEETFRKQFGRVFSRAFNVMCKDGANKEIEFRTSMLGDEATIVMLSDVTDRKRMHDLLESAATEWRTTFDAINDAVCLLDPHGKIIRCNNAMLQVMGKPFSQITNHHCWEVIHGVSEAPHNCPIALAGKTNHRETEVMFKDARWFNISVDPLLDDNGNFIGGVHIMSDITDRMRIQNELQDSREQLRNLTVHLESVREQERTNIAREIHDELAQALTALRMDVSWLDRRLPADAQSLSDKTESMGNLIDSTIQTVKRISAELRPGVLDDLGLVAAIEWQTEEFQNRTGIRCRVTVDPDDIAVDQDLATAIFRIFQETLTNVARHARATRVTVNLKRRAGKLTLRVKDNGIGITEEQISGSQSFGLIGMQERVVLWDGKISFKGIPDKGTTVTVSVGLDQDKKNRDKN